MEIKREQKLIKTQGNRWKDKNKVLSNPPDSNAFKAYNYFLDRGLTPEQSAGIVGNLAQESTVALDSTIENSIGAFGIAQWLGTRKKDLNKFAEDRSRQPQDFNLQLDFIWHELNTTEKRAFKALKETNNPQQAAAVFVDKFERSGEKEGDVGYNKRVNYASQFYNTFNKDNIIPLAPSETQITQGSFNSTPAIEQGLKMVEEYQEILHQSQLTQQRREEQIKTDAAKARLQEKINQRDFLAEFVNNSDIPFIAAKRAKTE